MRPIAFCDTEATAAALVAAVTAVPELRVRVERLESALFDALMRLTVKDQRIVAGANPEVVDLSALPF